MAADGSNIARPRTISAADLFCGAGSRQPHLFSSLYSVIKNAVTGWTKDPNHVPLVSVDAAPRAVALELWLVRQLKDAALIAAASLADYGQIRVAFPHADNAKAAWLAGCCAKLAICCCTKLSIVLTFCVMNAKLHAYLKDRSRADALAEACGTKTVYLRHIALGNRKASGVLASRIHAETKGEVSRESLRPDIFGEPASEQAA